MRICTLNISLLLQRVLSCQIQTIIHHLDAKPIHHCFDEFLLFLKTTAQRNVVHILRRIGLLTLVLHPPRKSSTQLDFFIYSYSDLAEFNWTKIQKSDQLMLNMLISF